MLEPVRSGHIGLAGSDGAAVPRERNTTPDLYESHLALQRRHSFAANLSWRWPLNWPAWAQHALAIGVILVGLGARLALEPLLQGRLPYVTLFLVLLPLVLLVRPGPFLVAALLGFGGTVYLFIAPHASVSAGDQVMWLQIALFLVAVGIATVTAWLSQRAHDRAGAATAMLRAFVDESPSCKWITDSQGRTVYVNRAMAQALGRAISEVIGRTPAELLPPDAAARAMQNIRAVQQSGQPGISLEALDPPGAAAQQRILEWRRFALKLSDDAPVLIAGSADDVTEHKQAEQALRRSQQRLQGLINSAMDAVITLDADQRIMLFNPAAERMFGCAASEVLGGTLDRFIPAAARAAHGRHIENFGRTGATTRCMGALGALSGVRANGELFPIEASISQVEVGRQKLFTVILRDITERKLAEQALRDADSRKNEFLATLSHELRNQLAPVVLSLDLLESPDGHGETSLEARATIRRQIQDVARLVDDLLDVSRVARGKLALRPEPLELAALLERAVETSRALLEQCGHELVLSLPEQPIVLQADPTRLRQIVVNLLNNACKFTPPGGRIALSARREADHVIISVRDNGIGMSAEAMQRVFDLFGQVHADRSLAHGGLGIGLSLVRQLVELHGGSVDVSSAGSNQGSEFIVRLPLAPAPCPSTALSSAPAPPFPANT